MKSNRSFHPWHLLWLVAIGMLGFGIYSTVFAANVLLPSPVCCDQNGALLRTAVEGGGIDLSNGVDTGTRVPGAQPGSAGQPFPKFSGVDTPVLISETGSIQVGDDTILHGLNDVRVGLINNGPPRPADLVISVSAATPAGSVLQKNSNLNFVAQLTFKNNSAQAITVKTIKMTKSGTATSSDLPSLHLKNGANGILANVVAANGYIYTASNLNWVIGAGGTDSLKIYANISAGAVGNRDFNQGILANVDVSATLANLQNAYVQGPPAYGASFTIKALPDHVVIYPGNDTYPVATLPMQFWSTIKNIGEVATAPSAQAQITIKNNVGATVFTATKWAPNDLGVGQTTYHYWDWTPPVAGNYSFTVCADAFNIFQEISEANNCASKNFTVDPIIGKNKSSDSMVAVQTAPDPFEISFSSYEINPIVLSSPKEERGAIAKLIGSFIPYAAAAGPPPFTPINPVYVYDDLYAYGNGSEVGNFFVNGGITNPTSNPLILNDNELVYVTGPGLAVENDFITVGNAVLNKSAVVMQNFAVGGSAGVVGDLSVTSNVNVTGNISATNITANKIGTYSLGWEQPIVGGTSWVWVPSNATWATDTVYCPSGAIVLSCSPSFWWTTPAQFNDPTNNISWYTDNALGSSCKVYVKQSKVAVSPELRYVAQAVCFDPKK